MKTSLYLLLFLAAITVPGLLFAQFTQQGSKLVGTGGGAESFQGSSVAISADGNTAVVGGIYDSSQQGAVWVFTRNAGAWTQQGPKLTGTGGAGDFVYQGYSVAISSDGNTVIESGWRDNTDTGAVWIFTRSAGTWTQQGSKLVGSGAVGGQILQGTSVAISSDGNTALVGGSGDGGTGAVWVFTRSGDTWTQHGSKLVGTGGVGPTNQGASLAISADGSTFVTGATIDNGYLGAVWIFTKSGSDWVQQGTKLVGSESIDASQQGSSVAISSDGNTVIIGGPGDFMNEGAVWVFVRSGGVWAQQGPKLYAEGSTSPILVGRSVAISPDGNTAIVSSPGSGGSVGKVWIFNRRAGVWTKEDSPLVGTGAVGAARQGWSVAISSDGTVIESGPYDNGGAGAFWAFHSPNMGIVQISGIPANAHLEQNYPNPFDQDTKIKFQLLKTSFTRVIVCDLMGREASTLVNEQLQPGTHEVDFTGSHLAGGTYFYKLETDGTVETKKMVLLK
ncbi:MAG: T9SS type A sorting domain-containing protein [Bacteroidetes bacterium]|nr:T9SS type A sorting domain-containing protein [Bacteroidota bacterium]